MTKYEASRELFFLDKSVVDSQIMICYIYINWYSIEYQFIYIYNIS